jgi:hypothetical protein
LSRFLRLVTPDYGGYDGVPVRTHFRFTSAGKISLTGGAQGGRLKCLGRCCRRPYSLVSVQLRVPHWHSNMRTVFPVLGSIILRTIIG